MNLTQAGQKVRNGEPEKNSITQQVPAKQNLQQIADRHDLLQRVPTLQFEIGGLLLF